jgi:hypothetical protein
MYKFHSNVLLASTMSCCRLLVFTYKCKPRACRHFDTQTKTCTPIIVRTLHLDDRGNGRGVRNAERVKSTNSLKLEESASKSCVSKNATIMDDWRIVSAPLLHKNIQTSFYDPWACFVANRWRRREFSCHIWNENEIWDCSVAISIIDLSWVKFHLIFLREMQKFETSQIFGKKTYIWGKTQIWARDSTTFLFRDVSILIS